jgi:aminoglycoside 6'-N-acetyltransferase I
MGARNEFGMVGYVMEFAVREIEFADWAAWAEMRAALWPEESVDAHALEIDDILKSGEMWAFIAELEDASVGFAEVAIRKYANGCESQPVPFLEGIWVRQEFRRQGIGAALIRYLEVFLAARGYRELGSDALIDNSISHESHRRWGFSETERVVYFRKPLAPPSG